MGRTEGRSDGGVERLVHSFWLVTKTCFLVKRHKIRVRNGKGNEKAEKQRNGGWTGEGAEIIEVGKGTEKIKTGHNNKKFMALSPPFRPNP